MTNLNKLTALIVEAVPEIMELGKGCKVKVDYGIATVKNPDAVITGKECSRLSNYIIDELCGFIEGECLDGRSFYDLKRGIRMDGSVILMKPKWFKILGRDINLEDCLFCIINKPKKDWEWKDKAIKILLDNWELMKCLSDQSEETINKLLEILQ